MLTERSNSNLTTGKRLRTDPPSPSSSSSPKRAASEDTTSSGLDGPSPLAIPSQISSAFPSSPLRMDVDDEQESTGGWVGRTAQVSLGEDDLNLDEDGDAPTPRLASKDVYDAVLHAVPPPFPAWTDMYIVPKPFLNEFSHYALGGGEGTPPVLDVTSLVDSPQPLELLSLVRGAEPVKIQYWQLKPGLVEDQDFSFLGPSGWEALTQFLSYSPQLPRLPRLCLPEDRVEIAPNLYRLCIATPTPTIPVPPAVPPMPVIFTSPNITTLANLRTSLRHVLGDRLAIGVPLRLWIVEDKPTTLEVDIKQLPKLSARVLSGTNENLAGAGLVNGDTIIVEVATSSSYGKPEFAVQVDDSGNAIEKASPLFAKPAFYSGTGASSSSTSLLALPNGPGTRSQSRGRRGDGLVGLNNLGNTCFMNSATQCLSNTAVLCDYFLTGVYREELNRDNPLGMHGQVAEAFGDVIQHLWTQSAHSSFSPRGLKMTCSRFAPQFAGYGQHDTQEFLAFLLDGLHEDLNRIHKKPYIEKPDWKAGGGDRELAELGKECWEGYKKRNDSVIVDLFQGQLQSTLVCPECHKESITMDPFMYLTVPLPIAQMRKMKLIYFPRDVEKPPVKVELLVPMNAAFTTVKDRLAALVKATSGSHIVGFDFWKHGVYQWWMDSDANGECKDHDTAIFHELGAPVSATHKGVGTLPTDGSVTVPVYTYTPYDGPRSSFQRDIVPSENCLEPFFVTLSAAEAQDPAAVRQAILRGYSRLVRPDHREALLGSMTADEDDGVVSARTSLDESDSLAPETIPRSASSVSIQSQTSRKGKESKEKDSKGGLFKVYVADPSTSESNTSVIGGYFRGKSDPKLHNLYRGDPGRASGAWSSLDKRARGKRHVLQRVASSLSNLVASAHNSEDEGDDAGPVVRPGEAIFVQWQAHKFDEFFVRNRDSLLGNLEVIVDPQIAKEAAKKRDGRTISLDDCLDEFSKEETLGQDDLWYCPVCKKHQAATKKLDIYKAPDILVICIKRFGSSRQLRDKLDHMVSFPMDGLDLDERIGERRIAQSLHLTDDEAKHYGIEHSTEPFIYDLYGVDNHFGGLGGGHYTAFCRNKEDDHWYNYDDSRVSKADPKSVQSRAAYLLFYRRRTERRIGGISRIKAEEASRAATPMPSEPTSPVIGPSVPASAMASQMPSTPGTPSQPSPAVSDDDSDDLPLRASRDRDLPAYSATDLTTAGASVGFGNTAWGSSSTTEPSPGRSVRHSFGNLPTPDSSDGEFVPVTSNTATSASGSVGGAETGLGEAYTVVSDGTSDAEMVSAPRSPPE